MIPLSTSVLYVFLLFSTSTTFAFYNGILLARKNYASKPNVLFSTPETSTERPKIDLTGYKLWCKFNGFGVANVTNGIALEDKFAADFSVGITADSPGYWRIVGYDDGRDTLEITHPIPPEYMYFFDLTDKQLLWRGRIDMQRMRVVDGEVLTNKKRFIFFPYTEVVGTFEASLLPPGQPLPELNIVPFNKQPWVPPEDFDTPFDMKRYPEIFDPVFVQWWFDREEALARGETPPPRPQSFFSPPGGLERERDQEKERLRPRRSKSGGGGMKKKDS